MMEGKGNTGSSSNSNVNSSGVPLSSVGGGAVSSGFPFSLPSVKEVVISSGGSASGMEDFFRSLSPLIQISPRRWGLPSPNPLSTGGGFGSFHSGHSYSSGGGGPSGIGLLASNPSFDRISNSNNNNNNNIATENDSLTTITTSSSSSSSAGGPTNMHGNRLDTPLIPDSPRFLDQSGFDSPRDLSTPSLELMSSSSNFPISTTPISTSYSSLLNGLSSPFESSPSFHHAALQSNNPSASGQSSNSMQQQRIGSILNFGSSPPLDSTCFRPIPKKPTPSSHSLDSSLDPLSPHNNSSVATSSTSSPSLSSSTGPQLGGMPFLRPLLGSHSVVGQSRPGFQEPLFPHLSSADFSTHPIGMSQYSSHHQLHPQVMYPVNTNQARTSQSHPIGPAAATHNSFHQHSPFQHLQQQQQQHSPHSLTLHHPSPFSSQTGGGNGNSGGANGRPDPLTTSPSTNLLHVMQNNNNSNKDFYRHPSQHHLVPLSPHSPHMQFQHDNSSSSNHLQVSPHVSSPLYSHLHGSQPHTVSPHSALGGAMSHHPPTGINQLDFQRMWKVQEVSPSQSSPSSSGSSGESSPSSTSSPSSGNAASGNGSNANNNGNINGGSNSQLAVCLPRDVYARGQNKRKPCNCKQSKCLKLYCECFAAGEYCLNCNCVGCCNVHEHEDARQDAIKATLKRNPPTQKQNKQKACHCKKSGCIKKYCECFQAGVACGDKCKCVECKNRGSGGDGVSSSPPTNSTTAAVSGQPSHLSNTRPSRPRAAKNAMKNDDSDEEESMESDSDPEDEYRPQSQQQPQQMPHFAMHQQMPQTYNSQYHHPHSENRDIPHVSYRTQASEKRNTLTSSSSPISASLSSPTTKYRTRALYETTEVEEHGSPSKRFRSSSDTNVHPVGRPNFKNAFS